MENLDSVNYDDLLAYANELVLKIGVLFTDKDRESKESLALWISNNEPNYDPSAE